MTPTEIINQTARNLAKAQGWNAPDGFDFVNCCSADAQWCVLAEIAYESITGDRPDYEENVEMNHE